jgi:ribosomal protein L34E
LKKKSHLVDILDLVKNKKLSNAKIKQEIKKYLKDPEQLNEFLQSILDSRTKKGENKEATSAGAGVGAFEGPLFSGEEPKKKETKEATSSSSIGQYDAPGFEDVKMRGNNPKGRGRSFKKTQLPGGKFVQVKKKCKRFPYCNQGDIKALNIFENETLNSTIEKISKKYGLSEDLIKEFILKEIRINNNK